MKPKTLNELKIEKKQPNYLTDKEWENCSLINGINPVFLQIVLGIQSCETKGDVEEILKEIWNKAIEDVRAMLMERVKELRQYKKVFIQTNQFTIEYGIQEIINELLRIAGKVKA
jgi:hypothetical protein